MLKQPDFGKIEMLKKEAERITGGLSAPSKMPGPAFNLPATQAGVPGPSTMGGGHDNTS